MVAAGIIPGEIKISNVVIEHSQSVISSLRACGIIIEKSGDNAVIASYAKKINPCSIITKPFPGFPTDMQAQFCVLLALANGQSKIKETIFENRFMHIGELNRLGAKILINHNTADISGVRKLSGAKIMATDLRASAALVLAGMSAEGITEIYRIYHIDRGYERIEKKLLPLGVDIQRVETDEM